MLVRHLFETYTPYRYPSSDRIRIGVWFNGQTGEIIDTTPRLNHAEQIATQYRKFGIPVAEIAALKRHPDFELDWNEATIALANKHHWVRVMAEGPAKSLELNIQSSDKKDVLKAARHFTAELSPAVIYVDYEVTSYNNVWHDRLEGDQIERFLKTGRLPK